MLHNVPCFYSRIALTATSQQTSKHIENKPLAKKRVDCCKRQCGPADESRKGARARCLLDWWIKPGCHASNNQTKSRGSRSVSPTKSRQTCDFILALLRLSAGQSSDDVVTRCCRATMRPFIIGATGSTQPPSDRGEHHHHPRRENDHDWHTVRCL